MKRLTALLLSLIIILPCALICHAEQEIIARGIDISRWQGEVDLQAVADSGIDFVILRLGYTGAKDIAFEEYYEAAREAGLDIGAYVYSYAADTETAEQDARDAAVWLEDKTLDYPLYYDLEDEVQGPLDVQELTDLALAFNKTAELYGWYAGVYSSEWWYNNRLDLEQLTDMPLWFAKWTSTGEPDNTPDEPYGIWQYSSKGSVPGINGDVDLDVAFFDYPSYIKENGLCGYEKSYLDPVLPFLDIKKSSWYYEDVKAAYEEGYFKGVTDTEFAPNGQVTRGMFVTILGRHYEADIGLYEGLGEFEDVSLSRYYAPYIAWARDVGIVNGVGEGRFAPDSPITREQMCTMICRYGEIAGMEFGGEDVTFEDDEEISGWAYDSVHTLAAASIINGTGNGYFTPKAYAKRCECAAIIMRIS